MGPDRRITQNGVQPVGARYLQATDLPKSSACIDTESQHIVDRMSREMVALFSFLRTGWLVWEALQIGKLFCARQVSVDFLTEESLKLWKWKIPETAAHLHQLPIKVSGYKCLAV